MPTTLSRAGRPRRRRQGRLGLAPRRRCDSQSHTTPERSLLLGRPDGLCRLGLTCPWGARWRSAVLPSELRRPPELRTEVEDDRGNEDAAYEEGVEQDAEGDDEADLREEDERQHGEHGEGAGEDDASAGDDAAGDRERAQDALLGAVLLSLLAGAGDQEDVVVDAERDEEHEGEQRQRRVRAWEVEEHVEGEVADAERGGEAEDHCPDQ